MPGVPGHMPPGAAWVEAAASQAAWTVPAARGGCLRDTAACLGHQAPQPHPSTTESTNKAGAEAQLRSDGGRHCCRGRWAIWAHAAGEDRSHDLRTMRPTRCQLRYCRSWQRSFAIPHARRAWAHAARGGVGRGHGNTGGLDSASRTGGLPQRHGRLLRSPSSSAPPQYD